jgi:hypothetical protein
MRTLLLTVGLMALLAVPAMAGGPPPQEASVEVTLVIEKYCYIEMSGSFDIVVPDGGASGPYCASLPFCAGANFPAVITDELTPPPGTEHLTWTNTIDPTGPFPGEICGTVEVCVDGITLSDLATTYPGGTKVITIQE